MPDDTCMTERPPDAGDRSAGAGEETPGPGKHHESAARRGGSGSHRGGADARPEQRTDGGRDDGIGARVRQVQQVVVWPESLIIGVSTWLVGLFLTVIPLWWFDFSGDLNEGTLDIGIWVYVEGVGGTIGNEVLFVTKGDTYGTFESNVFGLGPAIHALVPVLVLCVGGYVLAGRHLSAGRARRPLETILAGGSLAVWFTLTMVLAAVLASGGEFSVNLGETLVTTLLYAGVFTAVGAAVRSRARLTSAGGLLAGIGGFLLGVGAWFLVGSPFGDTPGVDGFSDLEGTLGYTRFLRRFVAEHGTGASEILPAWFVVVVPLLFGGVLAYAYERRDPVLGFGEGARLGVTYAMLVFFIVVGHIAAQARELERTSGAWSGEEVDMVNELIAVAPRGILLGGIVYPVVFAALGGALGAAVSDVVQRRNERGQRQARRQEPRASGSPAGQHQQEPETGPTRKSQSRSEQQSPARSEEGSSSQSPGESTDRAGQPAGESDQQPVGVSDGESAGDGRSGERHSDWFDEQSADEPEPHPAEPAETADEGGTGTDDGETEQSGETLSPEEIIGDELEGEDTEES
jgi:hypothetical protein